MGTTKRRRTGRERLGQPTLTAVDWVDAALQLIAESGVNALTVEELAGRLGVTKGSFYWHFEGRSDLLAAALFKWEQQATGHTITALAAVSDAHRRLQLMLDASAQHPRSRSLYAALAEAASDPVVAPVLKRVASARVEYLATCYRELGIEPVMAEAKAVFAYAAYRGLLQLAHEAPSTLPKDWSYYARTVHEALAPTPRRKSKREQT